MATNENLIPIPGRLHSVATEGHVAGADEIIDDNLNKDQQTINAEVNEALGTGGSVDSRIAAAINALDATKSQAAGADGLALSITEENGKITAISGSIAANTYDAHGAASTVKSDLLGDAATDYNTLGKLEDKIQAEATRAGNAESTLGGRVTTLETAVGSGGSVDTRIANAVNALDASVSGTSSDSHVSVSVVEANGKLTGVTVSTSDVAADSDLNPAAFLGEDDGSTPISGFDPVSEVSNLKSRVNTAENDIDGLQAAYRALYQSSVIVVADHTQVSSPVANTIYREQGTNSYIDWMYYNNAWQKMAEYDNAIDDRPTFGSGNLVKSEGIVKRDAVYLESAGNYTSDDMQTNDEKVNEVLKSVVDIWATDITDTTSSGAGSWYDDSYKLKIGFFGFDNNSISASTRFWFFVFFTNGTNNKISTLGAVTITNKNGINEFVTPLETLTGSVNIHMLVDFSRLDFSKISTAALSGFYYFITSGIKVTGGVFLNKKRNSKYNYANIQGVTSEVGNKSESVIQSLGVAKYIKSDPNLWFIGNDTAEGWPLWDASKRSVRDVIRDIWFEPAASVKSKFEDDSYYMKLELFSIDANTVEDITFIYLAPYLTNGTDTVEFGGKILISNPSEIQYITKATSNGTLHCVIDLNKLDFSTLPSYTTGYGYIILNFPGGYNKSYYIISKKTTSILSFCSELYSSQKKDQFDASLGIFYKMQYYDNILCAGDSVTKGMVVEGTQSNPQTIYQEIPSKSYPTELGKILPKAEITVKAQSGISCVGWQNTFYSGTDFSAYEMIIFELGLNGNDYGYLNISDINTSGTNTYAYRQIIAGVRSQNASAVIVLVRSSHWLDTAMPVLDYIANESDCLVVDLQSTEAKSIVNLDSAELHGYYNNGGTAEVDWAHFTRKGYNAKAYVVSRMIEARLSNATKYSA